MGALSVEANQMEMRMNFCAIRAPSQQALDFSRVKHDYYTQCVLTPNLPSFGKEKNSEYQVDMLKSKLQHMLKLLRKLTSADQMKNLTSGQKSQSWSDTPWMRISYTLLTLLYLLLWFSVWFILLFRIHTQYVTIERKLEIMFNLW